MPEASQEASWQAPAPATRMQQTGVTFAQLSPHTFPDTGRQLWASFYSALDLLRPGPGHPSPDS